MKIQEVKREDYCELNYITEDIHLVFELDAKKTIVRNKSIFKKNPMYKKSFEKINKLILDGKNLELIEISLNDKKLGIEEFEITNNNITLFIPEHFDHFTIEILNSINPSKNTELEGLYLSGEILCTQNEAQGFRNITYSLDRPDNLAVFKTTLIANKNLYPVILSNGDIIEDKMINEEFRSVTFLDPSKKPCYLFAIVAADLGVLKKDFYYKDNQKVELEIYSEHKNINQCEFAMECLVNSLEWEYNEYSLKYDLKTYRIVAVDSFNFGGMENKGLNIFNSSCILASNKTATDENFLKIERVIGHEYFHNWSGNRITLRDWFQLTLKEGLTVYRDQEFGKDMYHQELSRINDIKLLKERQFPEDQGKLRHSIRPESYVEINNFYTSTVYEKGAEVIRSLQYYIGKTDFINGVKYYFQKYDGIAATVENFIESIKVNTKKDISKYINWYSQVGTPVISINIVKKEDCHILSIQTTAEFNDHNLKDLLYSIKISLFNHEGKKIKFSLDQSLKNFENENTFYIDKLFFEHKLYGITEENILISANRKFTVPAIIETNLNPKEELLLAYYEDDLVNLYFLVEKIIVNQIISKNTLYQQDQIINLFKRFFHPKEQEKEYLGRIFEVKLFDSILIKSKRKILFSEALESFYLFYIKIVSHFSLDIQRELNKLNFLGLQDFNKEDIGLREYKNSLIEYSIFSQNKEICNQIQTHYKSSKNATDKLAAFKFMVSKNLINKDDMINIYLDDFSFDNQLFIKFLKVVGSSYSQNDFYELIIDLMNLDIFDSVSPTHNRALIEQFAKFNKEVFHKKDYSGYEFLKNFIIKIDKQNTSISTLLATLFSINIYLDEEQSEYIKNLCTLVLKEEISDALNETISRLIN